MLKVALQKLVGNGGSIHWRGIFSPLGCEEELFRLGYAKRDPIIVPGMDKKGVKITEAGLAFLNEHLITHERATSSDS